MKNQDITPRRFASVDQVADSEALHAIADAAPLTRCRLTGLGQAGPMPGISRWGHACEKRRFRRRQLNYVHRQRNARD